MPNIIGVRFRNVGKVYYFDPCDYTIRYHDHVIVETARGIEYGTVVITPTMLPEEKVPGPLKKVIRMATEEDDERERTNREKEKEAYRVCKQKITERGLNMKLIEAEYTFDNSKVLFYFTADGRIDFRELVKDLAGVFRTRIELRQIGVRDETKLLGGIGSCGRPLCCHTWLSEFAPVSIKMAKDQNLSLNPTKISGTCGRLMCCLKNEADTYAYLNKNLPGKGDLATTPDGLQGDVVSVNILRQTVKVVVDLGNDEREMQEFDVKDITFIPKSKRPKRENQGPAKGRGERAERTRGPRGKAPADEKEGAVETTDETAQTESLSGEERKPRRQRNRRNNGPRENAAPETGTIESAAPASDGAEKPSDAVEGAAAEGEKKRRRRRRSRHKGPKDGEGMSPAAQPGSADRELTEGE